MICETPNVLGMPYILTYATASIHYIFFKCIFTAACCVRKQKKFEIKNLSNPILTNYLYHYTNMHHHSNNPWHHESNYCKHECRSNIFVEPFLQLHRYN